MTNWKSSCAQGVGQTCRANSCKRVYTSYPLARFLLVFLTTLFFFFSCYSIKAAPLDDKEKEILLSLDPKSVQPYPSQAAFELARKIGFDGDVDKLKTVAELDNWQILSEVVSSFKLGKLDSSNNLPAPIENLIVEQYSNKSIRNVLLGFIARGLENYVRFPKYRSRALFDLIYSELKKNPSESYGYAIKIVATDLTGIEPDLIALLPNLEPASANEIVILIGLHRYAPAVSALRKFQEQTPYSRDENGLIGHIDWALLQINTPESIQTVLDRLVLLGQQASSQQADSQIYSILSYINSAPPDVRLDFASLRNKLPKTLPPNTQIALVDLIAKRQELRGVPDLIDAAMTGNYEAVTTLLNLGTPEDWQKGKQAIENGAVTGTIKPDRLIQLQKMLDVAIADPEKYIAKRSELASRKAFYEAREKLSSQYPDLQNLKLTDPKRYVLESEAYLQGAEKLFPNKAVKDSPIQYQQDVAQEYQRLADYTRYTLRDPKHAVALYEHAIALSETLPSPYDNTGLKERIGLAETLRFDLVNEQKALQIYQDLLPRVSRGPFSNNEIEIASHQFYKEWIQAEISYLSDGKRYSESPNPVTASGVGPFVVYGLEFLRVEDINLANKYALLRSQKMRKAEMDSFAKQLESLSPSQFWVLNTFSLLPTLGSSERIVAFMRKNDPTGYVTAVCFATWHLVEKVLKNNGPQEENVDINLLTWSPADIALMNKAEKSLLRQGSQQRGHNKGVTH